MVCKPGGRLFEIRLSNLEAPEMLRSVLIKAIYIIIVFLRSSRMMTSLMLFVCVYHIQGGSHLNLKMASLIGKRCF